MLNLAAEGGISDSPDHQGKGMATLRWEPGDAAAYAQAASVP